MLTLTMVDPSHLAQASAKTRKIADIRDRQSHRHRVALGVVCLRECLDPFLDSNGVCEWRSKSDESVRWIVVLPGPVALLAV
jgi:hypothetical protein